MDTARLDMNHQARNPGPSWGYSLIDFIDRVFPKAVVDFLMLIGSLFAMLLMSKQRCQSKEFLSEVLRRKATWKDALRHFTTFSHFLIYRFRAAKGYNPSFYPIGETEDRIECLARHKKQALYGAFHFGQSDLMGFWLSKFELTIRMVRHQVANSKDIEWLDRRFGDKVGFIWVNDPDDMLFELKAAIEDGHSIAMKCDRSSHSSKREVFDFLGKRRWFPFTIYHLSILFDIPVVFAFGIPRSDGNIDVRSSSSYWPDAATKRQNLDKAREHFQGVLQQLESLILQYPYQWFNFQDDLPIANALSECATINA